MKEGERWDAELDERASPAPLLQSWGWGEVQSRAGWSIERVRLPSDAMASVQVRSVALAREAYVPRGPVPATPEAVDALVDWARGVEMARIVARLNATAPGVVALAIEAMRSGGPVRTQP